MNKRTPLSKETSAFSYFPGLLLLMLLFAGLCFYKPQGHNYSVFTRTWGFDHFLFYSVPVQVTLFVIAFVLIVPYTNALLVKFIQATLSKLPGLKKSRLLLFIVLSCIAVILFYLFSVKYFFLGDMNMRLTQVMKKEFLTTEYLTMRLLYAFSTAGTKYGFTAEQMFVYYSCIAGGVYTFFSFLTADLLGKDRLQKLFFFMACVSSGLMLVFCGYFEIYATPVACLSAFLYAGLRYLHYTNRFYLVIISLCLAIASHLLCAALLPAAAVLWYFNNRSKFGFITAMSNKKIAFIISVLAFLAVFIALRSKTGLVLPLSHSNRDYMTLFSFRHFWEFVNGELLACGLSFIFFPLMVLKLVKRKIHVNASAYFIFCIAGCFVFMIALLNLHRGSGDWDIMALPAFSLNLAVAVLISILYAENNTVKNYLLLVIIGLNAIQTFLWLDINHGDKSIRKIDSMLSNDPGTYYTRLPSLLQLGIIYDMNGLLDEAEKTGAKACDDQRMYDPRNCMFYAKKLILNKKAEAAIPIIERVIFMTPYAMEPYFYILKYSQENKQEQRFFETANKLFDAFMKNPQPFLNDKNYGRSPTFTNLFTILADNQRKAGNNARALTIEKTVNTLKTMP